MTGSLSRIQHDYATVNRAPPLPGSESYHKAMIDAEAHTDQAVTLVGERLSTKDQSKFDKAKTVLDSLLKGK